MTLSYPEVGATAGTLPVGYRHIDRAARLGVDWESAQHEVMTWRVKERAGFTVERGRAGDTVTGELVVLHAGAVAEPVEVVYTVAEPNRHGFAYGTLIGHPLVGEELFLVERRGDETWLHIRSFSRVSRSWLLLTPLLRIVQRVTHTRYLRALS
ncbi:DUF1990 domain-containing protein [soil metagenome]